MFSSAPAFRFSHFLCIEDTWTRNCMLLCFRHETITWCDLFSDFELNAMLGRYINNNVSSPSACWGKVYYICVCMQTNIIQISMIPEKTTPKIFFSLQSLSNCSFYHLFHGKKWRRNLLFHFHCIASLTVSAFSVMIVRDCHALAQLLLSCCLVSILHIVIKR